MMRFDPSNQRRRRPGARPPGETGAVAGAAAPIADPGAVSPRATVVATLLVLGGIYQGY